MAGTFTLKNLLLPAKGRAASLQGGETVVGGGAVSLGTSQELASSIVNEYNTTVVEAVKQIHLINITDLLALDPQEIDETNLYRVYSSGSTETGWHEGGTFVLEGETYADGTYFQFVNGEWQEIVDEIDLTNYMRFNELPSAVSMIEATYADTSYNNLYGEGRGGLAIARIGNYRLDENGVYQPVFVEKGTAGQQYYSRNYTKTIYVPWARSYTQGGQTIYEGGALSPSDYETFKNLSPGGGGTTYTFQGGTNSFIVTPSSGEAQIVNVTPSIATDATPTANSTNPVQSGGVKAAMDGKMDTDASNATNTAVQTLLGTLPYTNNALTGDDSVVMKIDNADAYKEVPIASIADYIAAPVLASPASGAISDWDGKLVYQSAGANRTISAVLSPISINTAKHSAAVGAATASGDYSFASGYDNTASGDYSFASGQGNVASNSRAACLGGYSNTASGQGAACIGGSSSTASERYAVATGYYALADHDYMMSIGKYSRGWAASCAAHGISAAGSDYLLFAVGSGAGPNSRKNALEVWSTEEAYIGDRGVATLYTVTIEGNAEDSHPRLTYGTGLSGMGFGWSLDWYFFFSARQLLTTDKDVVANWYAEHALSVFYHDLDSDVVYSSFSDLGLRLGFHRSGAAWYPQIELTDKTYFTNKNFKCVVQFTGI